METIKNFAVAIKDLLLSKRMKSLYWRAVMMIVAGFSDVLTEALAGFSLTPEAKVFLGLVLGEISKAINNSLR